MSVLKSCTWAVSIVCVIALVAACTAVSPVTTPSRSNGQQYASMKDLHATNSGVMSNPPSGVKGQFCDSNMTSNLVSTVKAAGYDTTELAALITVGDCAKIKTWMDTFNTAHPGVLPTPPVKNGPAK